MAKTWNTKSLLKVPLLSIIFFLICILHNVLYTMKDALVITAKGSGAEVIPFIQLWLLLPFTCLVTIGLAKLLSRYGLATAFKVVFLGFIIFFSLFAGILYPCRDLLQPNELADAASQMLPLGLQGFVAMMRHWTLSLFFVVSELWAGMITSVIFWSLANEITPVGEAQTSYSWVRVAGAVGSTIAGQLPIAANWLMPEHSVYILLGIVIVGCFIIIGLFHLLSRYALDHLSIADLNAPKNVTKKGQSTGFLSQFKSILQTRYMICLACIVIGYNLFSNLFELVWKAQLKEVYSDFNSYNAVLGYASTVCGVLTFIFSVVVPKLLNRMGWTFTALITPALNLIMSAAFFGLLFFQNMLPIDPATVMTIAMYVGALQFSLGRAAKHSVFDVTKDMAYIPLDSSLKAQGKTAIDGLGSRAAKSGASFIHQSLIIVLGTVGAGTPFIAGAVICVALVWMGAAKSLGGQFDALTNPGKVNQETVPVAA